jgi:hypothetical protein
MRTILEEAKVQLGLMPEEEEETVVTNYVGSV